ncbi:MAG: hypothetical protein RL497_2029 [Pseudomonadota bacterium]|jgi:hypothetical protein
MSKLKVKGSKHYPMKVVPHRPMREWAMRAAVAAAFVGVLMVSYLQRQWQNRQLIDNLAQTQTALDEAKSAETQLRQQLANLSVGAEVDRKSNQDVRQEISALKEQVQLQQQQLSFYRSLMNPAEGKQGLAIGELEYTRGSEPLRYRYNLKVLQLANLDQISDFEGEWHFKLVGKQQGQWRGLELKDIAPNYNTASNKLKFKYFQTLSGEIVLPEGFEPEYTELEARAPGKTAINKRIKWNTANLVANQPDQ